jgi:hypothetical protein
MLKAMFAILILSSVAGAQLSSDGSFSVHHFKDASYSLRPMQMRLAENIYHNVCTIVQHDVHCGARELHPHFTVVILQKATRSSLGANRERDQNEEVGPTHICARSRRS